MDFQARSSQNRTDNANTNFSGMRGTNHNTAFSFAPKQHIHEKIVAENEPEANSSGIVAVLNGIITISLVALFFGIPLFFTSLTMQGIIFEKQIYFYFWILLALVSWVSKSIIVGEMKIRRTPLDIPLVLFWAVYGLGIIFSVDRWHSFWGAFGDPSRGFMNVTALAAAYFLIVSNFSKKRFILFSWSLVVSDFILAVWAFIHFMGLRVTPVKLDPFIPLSPIGSLTGLGIFLSAILPIIMVLIFSLFSDQRKSKKKIVAAAFLLTTLFLNLFILLILYSFVFWLGALVGVSFFLIYILAQIMRPSKNWTWLPMIVFVAVLAILMIGTNSLARVQLPVEASPSMQLSWDIAKNSLKNAFFVGSGPATYGYDFSLHRPQSFNLNPYYNLRFFQGSGLFFEALSTIGVVGTFFLILLTLTFISIGIYLLSTNKSRNKIYSLGVFSASLVILINAFSGKIEGSMIILGVLLIALTVASLLLESEAEENSLALSFKASPKYALALAFVFMVVSAGVIFLFVFIGKNYIADIRAGAAARESQITENGSVKKLASAIEWNRRESRYYTLFGQELMVLANQETQKNEKDRNLNLIQNYLNSSIAAASQARNLSNKDVVSVEALAQIYENSGLYVSDSFLLAEENYKKALELEPHNPLYYVKIGQIKLAQASSQKTPDSAKSLIKDAADSFQKAIDEKKDLAVAYYELALSQEALGNLDDAIKSIEQAAFLDQANINYAFNTARIHQGRGNDDDMKIAEAIYKNLIQAKDKDANIHFSLGLLYEKTKRTNEASQEYKKVLDILPKDSGDVRNKISKMIDNIAKGVENNAENLKLEGNSDTADSSQSGQ